MSPLEELNEACGEVLRCWHCMGLTTTLFLGIFDDIGGPYLCIIVILPVVEPFAEYTMSLAIRFVEVAGWDAESQEGASCHQLQTSHHLMREGKEVVSVERALDWCKVCRCDGAITCTVTYCSCASIILWDSHGTQPLEEYYAQDGWFMLVRKLINNLVA